MGEAAKSLFSAAAAPPLSLPRRMGRRVLLKLAARGGMGDVYLAATTGLEGAERPCIVKTVRRDHVHDGSFLARFLDEARVQAQLNHPGVAQVLEAATDDEGEPYTVVEYVEGRSLGDVRQRSVQTGSRIPWADAAAIGIEITQALAHVHERAGPDGAPLGIVHRDLSPQNVMVGYAGEVKLIDFGTARGHNRRCHTVAGVVFAKPGYVAPEVARQQVGDGRIDLYALGVMLWELCAGRRFLATDPQRHLDDVAAGNVFLPPISQFCDAPPELDDIIARLTYNDPDDRYARASLAVRDLARLLSSAPAAENSERSVRARVGAMMHRLWSHEPARARAEFVRLLREARETLREDPSFDGVPPSSESRLSSAAAARSDDPSLLGGTPYRLVRTIGEGASGVVWEAEHVELGRRVALKVLAAEHASSPASLERFRREARALATLSHPNLVETLDFGRSLDGRVFLAMELVVGETLEAKLEGGPLPWREATRVAIETCGALATAHASGLVHRDLKPGNLMLTSAGQVKLLDFGVAMAISDAGIGNPAAACLTPGAARARRAERALHGFAIFGTPEYMSPEQVSGDPVDPRTDLYALGCVLYEMLTGAPPFDGPSSVVVMGKQLREAPQPLRSRVPEPSAPIALEAVVMRALAKDRTKRWPSAQALQEALEKAIAAPHQRRIRARRLAAGALLASSMLASAGLSAHWTRAHLAGWPASAAAWTPGDPAATSTGTAPGVTSAAPPPVPFLPAAAASPTPTHLVETRPTHEGDATPRPRSADTAPRAPDRGDRSSARERDPLAPHRALLSRVNH